MVEKCYEYWSSEDGKPVKKITPWFLWDSSMREPWQLKNRLRNFYREV
jgi:hypothetical protein